MVRINLIPKAYIERKIRRRKILITVIFLSVIFIINVATYASKQLTLASLKAEVAKVEEEIMREKPKLLELEQLERENAAKLEDLKSLAELEKGRLVWIHLLEKLCLSIANQKVWLESYSFSRHGNNVDVTVSGVGLSNFEVANYMLSLMEHFKNVQFGGLTAAKIAGYPVAKFNFSFTYVGEE